MDLEKAIPLENNLDIIKSNIIWIIQNNIKFWDSLLLEGGSDLENLIKIVRETKKKTVNFKAFKVFGIFRGF